MYTFWSSYQHILTKSPESITDGWRQWFLNEMYHKVLHFCKLFVFVLLSELEHRFCEWSVKFSAVIGNNAATVMKLMKRLNTTDSINFVLKLCVFVWLRCRQQHKRYILLLGGILCSLMYVSLLYTSARLNQSVWKMPFFPSQGTNFLLIIIALVDTYF